jgi:hypothetical protein
MRENREGLPVVDFNCTIEAFFTGLRLIGATERPVRATAGRHVDDKGMFTAFMINAGGARE